MAWIDPDTGIRKWMGLRADLEAAQVRIVSLETDVRRQAEEASRLEADPLAIEAAIREDLGLARPGDTVVILPGSADPGPANREPTKRGAAKKGLPGAL